jgi:hypothetical protein
MMDFLRFSTSNAPIRLIRAPLRGHIPRRWHSGPLYENAKKPDKIAGQQKPSQQESPLKGQVEEQTSTQSGTPFIGSSGNPHVRFPFISS